MELCTGRLHPCLMQVVLDGHPKTFSTCRGISVITTNNTDVVYIELNDGQGQLIPMGGFVNNPLLSVGATTISGGDITSAVLLF